MRSPVLVRPPLRNVLSIPSCIKHRSHVWCKFKVWRSSGQHWPDSSNLNKCVDQNCLFCKNWIVFVIKLWLESCSFPNYPSATIFTPALNPANAILNTTKSRSSGVSQPKLYLAVLSSSLWALILRFDFFPCIKNLFFFGVASIAKHQWVWQLFCICIEIALSSWCCYYTDMISMFDKSIQYYI